MNAAVLDRPKGRCAKFAREDGKDPRWVPFDDGVNAMSAGDVIKKAGGAVGDSSTINVAGHRANLETPVRPGESVSLTPNVGMG